MMRQRSNTSPILRLTRNLICIGIAAFLILFTQNEQFCKKIIPTTNEQLETYSDKADRSKAGRGDLVRLRFLFLLYDQA